MQRAVAHHYKTQIQQQPNNPKKQRARAGQTWQTRCAQKSVENLYGCITKQRMA